MYEEDDIEDYDLLIEYCDNCQQLTEFTILSISPRTNYTHGTKTASCDICGDEVDHEF